MRGLDWTSGVVVGSSTLSVKKIDAGWELRRNGEGLQVFRDERLANQRALRLLLALQPDDRPTCLVCGRTVGLNNRKRIAPHNSEPASPGRVPRPCPGSGLKADQS